MANNKLQFSEDAKFLLHEHEGKTYLALQDIDSCDIASEIAEDVTGVTLALPSEIYCDTSDSFDFGCEYEWYAVEFAVVNDNGNYRVITSDFIGSIPHKPH